MFKPFASNHHPTFRFLSRTHGSLSRKKPAGLYKNRREKAKRVKNIILNAPMVTPERNDTIFTLDPNKFATVKQQRLSLGNKSLYDVYLHLPNQSPPIQKQRLYYDCSRNPTCLTPPDTEAFLYYITPPGRPRLGGELRLRVTSSDHPTSFASGSDLLGKNGQIWARPLYSISRDFIPVYRKLREEQFVSPELHSILSTLPRQRLAYISGQNQLLYTLNDPFIFDFSATKCSLVALTEQGLVILPIWKAFFHLRDYRNGPPYTGSVMARFERSTLPGDAGRRIVVLRFLKIIKPVECIIPFYNGYIARPKEGELYHKRLSSKESDLNVWSANIDKSQSDSDIVSGLRLLWDL